MLLTEIIKMHMRNKKRKIYKNLQYLKCIDILYDTNTYEFHFLKMISAEKDCVTVIVFENGDGYRLNKWN